MSATDAGNFQRTRDNGATIDDDADVEAAQSSPDAPAALRSVHLLSASNLRPHSNLLFDTETYGSSNDEDIYSGPAVFTKRRKPPEYVGYAVNVDPDVDEQGQSTKLKESDANKSATDNAVRDKTNVVKLPVHDWKADDDRVWRAACRELNCVTGSKCVPDTLRGGRPRCQCPLGTDGRRCEHRTSVI